MDGVFQFVGNGEEMIGFLFLPFGRTCPNQSIDKTFPRRSRKYRVYARGRVFNASGSTRSSKAVSMHTTAAAKYKFA